MTGHVGQYAQDDADDGRVARCHTVHAVVEVGTVGDCRHHEDGHEDKQEPAAHLLVLAQPVEGIGIVEVVVLEEGDGGLGRLCRLALVNNLGSRIGSTLHLDIFADNRIVAQIERETHDDAKAYLTDDLELAVQALLIALEHLDIVVGKAQGAQPYRGDKHENHIYIVETAEQQAWDEYRCQDDDTTHRGSAYLLHTEGVDARIALRLGNLLALEHIDKVLTIDGRHQQRNDDGQQ